MGSRFMGLALGISLALLAHTAPLQAQGDSFEWSGAMTRGQTLEVKGIVGAIRAVPASGNQARVVAVKRGDEDDFDEVAVEMVEVGNQIIICAVYGSWNHGRNHCDPDARDRDADRERHRNVNIDVDVDYEVQVPAGVKFEGAMVSGDITARGMASDVDVNTVDGDIFVSTSGRAWANTVSGDMEIEMGTTGNEDMDFHTVSGNITLWLPSSFAADVDFNSLSGDFDSDFDIAITRQRSRFIGNQVEGTIGGGGIDLSVNTVSGDLRIRRRG